MRDGPWQQENGTGFDLEDGHNRCHGLGKELSYMGGKVDEQLKAIANVARTTQSKCVHNGVLAKPFWFRVQYRA